MFLEVGEKVFHFLRAAEDSTMCKSEYLDIFNQRDPILQFQKLIISTELQWGDTTLESYSF